MRRLLRWSLAFVGLCFVLIGLLMSTAYPYLAVHRPLHVPVVVVEGWMPDEALEEAYAQYRRQGGEQLIVTGTVQALNALLQRGDSLKLPLAEGTGTVRLVVAGLSGTPFQVLLGTDTLLSSIATDDGQRLKYTVEGREGPLTVVAADTGRGTDPVLYVWRVTMDRREMHGLGLQALRVRGGIQDTLPRISFAERAETFMREQGARSEELVALAAEASTGGRTRATARKCRELLLERGIDRVDVITQSVHARRTWRHYKRALKGVAEVGIHSLPEPALPPDGWWRTKIGWAKVLKELIGMQQFVGDDDEGTFEGHAR